MTTIVELFEEQAATAPSAVALRFGSEHVTYEALNARANRLARYLRRHGAGVEAPIAVCMPHGVELVVVLLALTKAGAAYVGLDPAWPRPWMSEVLDASPVAFAITDPDFGDVPASRRCRALVLRDHPCDIAAESAENLRIVMKPDDLFSIVHTSGSTQKPKGVMITARSVLNRMEWMWSTYPFRNGDVALVYRSHAAVGFSWDCFGALVKGVTTVIHSASGARSAAEVVAASIEHRVTHLTASAGLWELILDEVERSATGIPSLRLARATGEALRPETVERWRHAFPHGTLLNIYGATECSGSIAADVTSFDTHGAKRVPVGTPIPGVHVFVVDSALRVLGVGRVGEVCVGGASLARGYLGPAMMTAERFVPSPCSRAGERVFRTGDLGFWRPDGQLELVGRRDLQVKVRGFRVELEQIEAALRDYPGVAGAAVRAERDETGVRLVALLESNVDALGVHQLRGALHGSLPGYMVPSEFLRVACLPRTPNGKLDRRALKNCPARPLDSSHGAAAPATPSQAAVAAIWQRVLGLQHVGIDDDFFALGGHSMAAMRILTQVHDTFGVELPLTAFFDAQTVRGLASGIDVAARVRSIPPTRESKTNRGKSCSKSRRRRGTAAGSQAAT